MAEFIAIHYNLASTKFSLFCAIKSLHPCISIDKIELFDASICKPILYQKALDISRNIQTT